MRVDTFYTFPLQPPMRKPLCTFVRSGPEGIFGFAIKALAERPEHGNFSFFQIDSIRGTISHSSTSSLPAGHIDGMYLCYDHIQNVWVLAADGFRESLGVYEVHSGINQIWPQLHWIDRQNMGSGNKVTIALRQQKQAYPLIFSKSDVGEVSDTSIYWTQWRPDEPFSYYPPPLLLGYCDTSISYIEDEGCLLFLCKRALDEEAKDPYLKCGPGDWRIVIAAYQLDGTLIQEEHLPEITYPIQNIRLPSEDFFNWLRVCISVTTGPYIGSDNRRTCVAALNLLDSTSSSSELAQKGGLYWVDIQGRVICRDLSLLGEQISICLCRDRIIGTDVFEGHRRLWQWFPIAGNEKKIELDLSSNTTRATVIAIKSEEKENVSQFWCVEEYTDGVKISRWQCDPLTILEEVSYEGITLLDDLVASYIRDRKPQGIVAFQNLLFLLGIDKDQRLKLLRVQ